MKQINANTLELGYFLDQIVRPQLDIIKEQVLKHDRDWTAVIDGEEGVGKSVLAQQIAKYLDPDFNLDNIVFNSDDFIKAIKNPNVKKGACIVLDEAFSSANSRASMTDVNRSLIAVATEMRQKNLFILIVIPSFFDLDKYFALWRCKALFHVIFRPDGSRGSYYVYPKEVKKLLYINGKKTYNYTNPLSPFAVCSFGNTYTVGEMEYRTKKSEAFRKRTVSHMARNWLEQRNAYIKFIYSVMGVSQDEIAKIPARYGYTPVGQQQISNLVKEVMNDRQE